MNASPLRVCSFESRRREEMARLIERAGARPTIAPSMREIRLEDNSAVWTFAEALLTDRIDCVIFTTGVGTETLFAALATRHLDEAVRSALNSKLVIARGPKPAAALSRLHIRVNLKAPEPNTWAEIVKEIQQQGIEISGKMIAVQEYGAPSVELYEWLQSQGAQVMPVPVYRWGLPDDIAPLQRAIEDTISGQFDVLLWTSAQQVNHVLDVAETMGLREEWKTAGNQCVIGSIGPTASERLQSLGLPPDLEPSHPKMAHLVRETLLQAPEILARKKPAIVQ